MSQKAKFKAPNFTKVPNSFVDEDLKDLGLAETKIMLVVMRKTLGWHERFKKISLSTFQELTGLCRTVVSDTCDALEKKGWFTIHRSEGKSNVFELSMEQEKEEEEDETSRVALPVKEETSRVALPVTSRVALPFKEKEKEKNKQTEVVVFSCLKDLGISQDIQQQISTDHPEAKCIELVRRFHAWKTKDSPEAAIFTLLKRWDTWDATPSKEEQKKAEEGQKMTIVESNRQWAKELYAKIKSKLHDARIFIVDETRVQINNLKGAVQSFGYLEQNLQQIVNSFLQRMEIAV